MPWIGAAIGAGVGLLGSSMSSSAAKSAAQTSANAQIEAARIAAEESRFRPVGVTTRFGTSQFGFGDDGRLSTAGYTVSPELQAYQDRIRGLTGRGLGFAEQAPDMYAPLQQGAQGLFNLGSQYIGQSPQDVASRYIQQQQDLLAPGRERSFAQLQNQLFNTGRGGLAVGATGLRPGGGLGFGAANPEMEAYYNAMAQQDMALAAQAEQEGQRQTAFGAGLFGSGAGLLGSYGSGVSGAYAPFSTGLGLGGQIEDLGRGGFDIGVNLGGRNVNQMGAQALFAGGQGAARTIQGAASDPLGAFLQNQGRRMSAFDYGGGTGAAPTMFGGFDPYSYAPNAPGNPYVSNFTGAYNPLALGGLEN